MNFGARNDWNDYTWLRYGPLPDDEDEESERIDSDQSTMLSPTLIPPTIDMDFEPSARSEPSSPSSRAFSPSPNATTQLPDMHRWTAIVAQHTHDHLPPLASAPDDGPPEYDAHPSTLPPSSTNHNHKPASQKGPAPSRFQDRRVSDRTSIAPLLVGNGGIYSESSVGTDMFRELPEPPKRTSHLTPAATHPFLLISMQTAQDPLIGNANPSRLLISSTLASSSMQRYAVSDSLFSKVPPPWVRSSAPAPSHPIPENLSAPTILLPPPQPRRLDSTTSQSLDPQPLHLASHFPALGEKVVKPGVWERSNMITPPTALIENGLPLLFGKAVRAPWNKQAGQQIRGDRPSELTDALLYPTWPVNTKPPEEEKAL
jgi:hypothetical protein